jgi:DNA-binding CsgD family transcriptional regulator
MGEVGHVVVVSVRRAHAEALAACCRQRGWRTTVVEPRGALPVAGVVLLDLTDSEDQVLEYGLANTVVGARTVGVGSARQGRASELDGWVDVRASLDDLFAVIAGTRTRARSAMSALVPEDRVFRLTPREEQVLGELLGGGDTTLIAGRLDISPQTVRTHVQNILVKLGVTSRAQAAAWAMRNGLLPVDRDERQAS